MRKAAPLTARAHRFLVFLALGVLALMALGAASASANNRFDLDPAATSAGNLAEDAAGNAYIGWMDEGVAKFCKIPAGGTCTTPIVLPLAGSHPPDQIHPVLGSGSTVYLVGPSYDGDDVEIWTSTNGGASFGLPVRSTGGYADKTEPNSVVLSGTNFLIGSSHPSVGVGVTPVAGTTGTNFEFAGANGPYSLQGNLALAAPGDPVEVWWEYINSSPVQFSRYKGGSLTSESDWSAPATVSTGEVPRLASGAAGLFLLSDDYGAGATEADQVDVRKYSTTGFNFGTPLTLSASPAYDFQDGGAIGESSSGLVAVAWPQPAGGDAGTMDLYVSGDGGATFGAPTAIAHIAPGYGNGDNAQLTINDSGGGWLTYLDEGGLEVADLSPVPVPVATPVVSTVKPTPKPTAPKTYAGATKTISTPVGGENLELRLPQECLASLQPFYVGVGKAKRHGIAKALRTPIDVQKMTFSFDSLKKTLKKKPFRWLVKPPALLAGHQYLVKARVSVTVTKGGKKKSLVKTLKGNVSIC